MSRCAGRRAGHRPGHSRGPGTAQRPATPDGSGDMTTPATMTGRAADQTCAAAWRLAAIFRRAVRVSRRQHRPANRPLLRREGRRHVAPLQVKHDKQQPDDKHNAYPRAARAAFPDLSLFHSLNPYDARPHGGGGPDARRTMPDQVARSKPAPIAMVNGALPPLGEIGGRRTHSEKSEAPGPSEKSERKNRPRRNPRPVSSKAVGEIRRRERTRPCR